MAISWGARKEIEEEVKEQLAGDRAEVKKGKRLNQEREDELDYREKRYEARKAVDQEIFDNSKSIVAKQVELERVKVDLDNQKAQAAFELEKADFEITKRNLANEQLNLKKTVDQAKSDYEAQAKVQVMEATVDLNNTINNLRGDVAGFEAKLDAKDAIIASKDAEISRLDELLKVTMGKLTQIDIKGLNIHVEAAQPGKGNRPEGKPEGK